jgi:ketosteroid isomerase-like protein
MREVIAFFDTMGRIMGKSHPTIEKLIVCENDRHVIECSHIRTNLQGGPNIDHHVCVLWTLEQGKIVSGRHFFADPGLVNGYFNEVTAKGLADN